MNRKQVAVVIGVLGLAVFAGIASAQSQLALIWENQCAGLGDGIAQLHVSADNVQCWGEISPVPPTETPVSPTDTPVSPTDTPIPPSETPVPPSPTPEGPIEPFENALLCPTHDNRAYHSLWDEVRGCHYNHEHKANPHDLDHIFGTSFYDIAGGEISYPWQTFHPPGGPGNMENDIKHEGYGWLVYEDAGLCDSVTEDASCIRAFRFQYHGVFSALGAVVQFHSYAAEIQVCDEATQTCGIVRTAGWVNSCGLEIDGTLYPVPDQAALDDCPALNTVIKRIHTAGNADTAGWYNTTLNKVFEGFAINSESWGPIDPNDPYTVTLYGTYSSNGSFANIHSTAGTITSSNFSGHTDRFGNLVECSVVGLDCIPFEVENAPLGYYYWRDDNPAHVSGPGFRGVGSFFEGDIVFSGFKGLWIEHPN